MQSIGSRDSTISQLIRCFLNPQFLMRSKFGVPRQESQLSIHSVLNTLFRGTLIQRLIAVIKNFHVVLASTDIASIGSHSDLRLDLARPHNDRLHNYQATDFIGSQI